tara:strand:- start:46 stop:612 length:567 start_codon:yes stop_codon:yes gene_type:complete
VIFKNLRELNLISVRDFWEVSSQERILINNSIEKNYLKSPLRRGDTSYKGNNFRLDDDHTLFFSHLYEKYKALCYELFGNFHITPQNKTTCWCYRSNINDFKSLWHNHLATSTINGVYYYQVEGDGIFFERNGKEFHYIPQQEELLIFPNDLNHNAAMTTSQTLRYSINMEIKTEESASTLFKNYGLS